MLFCLLKCKLLVMKDDLEKRNAAFYVYQDLSLELVAVLLRTQDPPSCISWCLTCYGEAIDMSDGPDMPCLTLDLCIKSCKYRLDMKMTPVIVGLNHNVTSPAIAQKRQTADAVAGCGPFGA